MAADSLKHWLHGAVKTQLDLGHSWLEEQHQLKAEAHRARPSTAIDTKWDGIYHNNGSCIDIIGPLPSAHAPEQVLVLQVRGCCSAALLRPLPASQLSVHADGTSGHHRRPPSLRDRSHHRLPQRPARTPPRPPTLRRHPMGCQQVRYTVHLIRPSTKQAPVAVGTS